MQSLKPSDKLNLERSLAVGARMGGHFVTGHVDGTGCIMNTLKCSNAINYIIQLDDPQLLQYCLHKGSIAIDGTSLTIFGIDTTNSSIQLSLIPHTVANSVLGYKKIGDGVNLECDMLGKYIIDRYNNTQQAHQTSYQTNTTTIDHNLLLENGFI